MSDSADLARIFSCLASQQRRRMLLSGHQDNAKNRYAKNMERAGILKKDNGSYVPSPLGSAVSAGVRAIEFLNAHRAFFDDHDFGDIPQHLVAGIGSLQNSTFYYGIHIMFSKWARIISESERFVNCILGMPPILIADSIQQRMENGVKVRLLFGKNAKIPDCNEFVNKLHLRKLIRQKGFEKRITQTTLINLIMSEKEACLIFPDDSGVTDIHGNFVSSDPDFVSWCCELFTHKWDKAEPISRFR